MTPVNKRIDLVNLASSFRKVEDLSRPPLGLLYVGSALKKEGYDVRIHHIAQKDIDSTCAQILDRDPLYVGFSSFTGPAIKNTVSLMQKLKTSNPNIKIVWGGVHPSLVPEQCLEIDAVDFVCIGEGEETIVDFTNNFQNQDRLDSVRGIGFKGKGSTIINPERPLMENLDDVEIDWGLLENLQQYVKIAGEKKLFPLYSSRGCPHNCGFCYNLKFNKRRWRGHNAGYVLRMAEALKKRVEFNTVAFDDDNFFTDKERGVNIICSLKKIGIDTDWVEIRVSYIDKKITGELSELGIKSIFTGWESGSDRLLGLIDKKITRADILNRLSLLNDYKSFRQIDAAGIIGFPTETWEETRQTIDLALEISRRVPNVNLMIQTYLPFPGTDLFSLAVKEGFLVPRTAQEWGKFDVIEGDFKITWLKEYPFKDIRKRFYYISKYVFLLNRVKENSWFLTLGKRFLYYPAYLRLKYQFFWFPWEIYILDIVGGWIIRKRRKNTF